MERPPQSTALDLGCTCEKGKEGSIDARTKHDHDADGDEPTDAPGGDGGGRGHGVGGRTPDRMDG